MTDLPVAQVLERVDANLDASVERLFDILRIPSVSTDPAFTEHVNRAAHWMSDELTGLGFTASVRPTTGHPMVVAQHPGPGGDAPHILYYGHYDVQPADPLELWNSGPFEPVLVDAERGKRIVARGAVDDKGQVMTWIEAFRAWRDVHGTLPCRITVLLEGEEECGSPSLDPFMAANVDDLKADVCVVCDTGMWDVDQPAITYSLRGMVYQEVTIHGPSRDLHSGMYGGVVVNPLNLLAHILGELHDGKGRVQIPHFYDDVIPVGANEKTQWESLGYDEKAAMADIGLPSAGGGEAGFNALERQWARPTCDVNGILGGYVDAGAKTVIAREAMAKISCRLVPDQDPDAVATNLQKFITDRLPEGYTASFVGLGGSPAIRVPTDSPYLGAAMQGLSDVFGKEAYLIGTGGSIPAVGSIRKYLGIDSILLGFGLEDDRVHSPNEKFELVCFHNGIRSNAAVLARMAGIAKAKS
ncbi:MAG: M20/M25/M40 family metallo-hydrolase [Thalassobaculum sp.]|uniref:M20/M25/M40 family metallo-hydrolase n=1 Tax=Thalassobaculum sp. TaxID=2022740 RepID=UPI0032EF2E95